MITKKAFLVYTILVVVLISLLATMYPTETFIIALVSLPFTFIWCVVTAPNKKEMGERHRDHGTN